MFFYDSQEVSVGSCVLEHLFKTMLELKPVMGENRIWRSRPRLLFWVSWERDRDRDLYVRSCGIETETFE